MEDSLRPDDWLDMRTILRNSELGFPVNKNVEMLNYAPHPVVEDVRQLPGNAPFPILADTLEYDRALPEAAHQSFRACIEALPHYPDLPQVCSAGVVDLIKDFVRLICADPHLPIIYAGHQEADAAYLRRILS